MTAYYFGQGVMRSLATNSRTVIVCLGVTLMAACSASDQTPPVADDSTLTPDSEYESVIELKDAAVVAGLPCPNWKQSNLVKLAAESGSCSGSSVLATFSTDRSLGQQVESYRSIAELFKDTGIEKDPVLVGPNWTINSPEAKTLQPILGGTILK